MLLRSKKEDDGYMECANHPNKEAQAICVNCGKPCCSDCLIVVNRKNYCKNCLKHKVEQKTSDFPHQKQPQQSKSFFASNNWDTNAKIGKNALIMFLVSIFLMILGNYLKVSAFTGIGALTLVISLLIGYAYAMGFPKKIEG
jgi:hypothetical protein